MRQPLKLILALFVVLVLIPTYLSWGPGIDWSCSVMTLNHHAAANSLGIFFLVLTLLFAVSRTFREACLERTAAYDAADPPCHHRIETGLLVLLTLWLTFLRWKQCQTLNTAAFDHGMFVNALWNVAHGQGLWSSLLGRHFFSEHFSPILYVLAVPYYFCKSAVWLLWAKTWAMMAAVALAVGLGRDVHPVRATERLLLILFFVINKYFQEINAFDIQPIGFALAVVILYYGWARRGRWELFYVFLPLALFGIQEDVSLMLAGLGLCLLFSRSTRKHGASLIAASLIVFVVIVTQFIPHYAGHASRFMDRYQTMGGGLKGILLTLTTKPWVPVALLFKPSHAIPLITLLFSYGFMPLAALPVLLGALPGALQHSLSDFSMQYRYTIHYSANLLPFLMLGTLAGLSTRKFPLRWGIPLFLLLMSYSSFHEPQYVFWRDPAEVRRVWELAQATGPEVKVSVQNRIGVPFCFRRDVYQFPEIKDAGLIVVSPRENPLPLESVAFAARLDELRKDPQWIWEMQDGLWIFRRKG